MQLWTDQQECVPLTCRQVWEGVNSFCKQVYYDNKMSKSPFQAYTVTDTNSPLCDCGLVFKNIFLMHVRRPYPQEMCVLGPVFAFLGRFSIPTNPSGSTDVICWDSHSLECYRHQSYEGKNKRPLSEVSFILLQTPVNVQADLREWLLFSFEWT